MGKNSNVLNRKLYSMRTLELFNLLASFYTQIYYVIMYNNSVRDKNEKKYSTVTESYRHQCYAVITALDSRHTDRYNPEHYKDLLKNIYTYMLNNSSYSTLALSDCIDKIVREFVPEDYFESFDSSNKQKTLRKILVNVMNNITKAVLNDYLIIVIDKREEKSNIPIIKQVIVDILIYERNDMFTKFIDINKNSSDELVSKKYVEKMRDELYKALEDKKELLAMVDQLEEENTNKRDIMLKLTNSYKSLLSKHKLLQAEYLAQADRLMAQEAQNTRESYVVKEASKVAKVQEASKVPKVQTNIRNLNSINNFKQPIVDYDIDLGTNFSLATPVDEQIANTSPVTQKPPVVSRIPQPISSPAILNNKVKKKILKQTELSDEENIEDQNDHIRQEDQNDHNSLNGLNEIGGLNASNSDASDSDESIKYIPRSPVI